MPVYVGSTLIDGVNVTINNVGSSDGIVPTGEIDISANGVYDVAEYASANVNVPDTVPVTQSKTVSPTTSQQTITPDDGYDGLSQVTVSPVTSSIDSDIQPENIKKGIEILGVTGTYEAPVPSMQTKTVSPSTSQQDITPDTSYDGLSKVTVNAVTSSIDSDIQSENIKKGVEILGVTGTYEAPTPVNQSKTVTPTTSQQTITPDDGYDSLSQVIVDAVTASIDSDIQAGNIKKGVEILGVTGTYEAPTPAMQSKTVSPSTSQQEIIPDSGYDGLSQVTVNAMPSGDLSTPSIDTSTGVVTASVSTSGYIASGTSKTLQLSIKGSATITPTESEQTIASGIYLTGTQTIAAIPSDYIGSAVIFNTYYTGSTDPSSSLGVDGDIYLKTT